MDRHRPIRHRPDEQTAASGGVPPVVWHLPSGVPPNCLSPQAAGLLLGTHSQPGDVVLDIDDDVAFAAAAAAAGRRHHALAGAQHLADIGRAGGYLDLILLHWPRPSINPRWLLEQCRSLLRPTGCLVIAAHLNPNQRAAHLSALDGAASTARLRRVRHVAVVALAAATPAATPDPHTDLLIFEVATDAR